MVGFEIEASCGWPHRRVVGVDEAGRGAWMGAVYAAAVFLPDDFDPSGLDDSKRLTAAQREKQYARLIGEDAHLGVVVGVGSASIAEIDQLNILQATFLAMERAIGASQAEYALIDGNRVPTLSPPCQAIIGGDRFVASIAAASIVAKVTRDREVSALATQFPAYGWPQNKGYGTKLHRKALMQHGLSPHHRRSFAPMREMSSPGGPEDTVSSGCG